MLSPHRFLWVPLTATALAAGASARESYLRMYYTVHFLDKARGIDHDHPSVDRFRMRAGGVAASILTGAVTFFVFKRALYSILLSSRPRADRLFDTLTPAELPPPLTPPAAAPTPWSCRCAQQNR